MLTWHTGKTAVHKVEAAVRAGIQSAHETWEPSDHPSQEMMLRWLGIDFEDGTADDGEPAWCILPQTIEKEVI